MIRVTLKADGGLPGDSASSTPLKGLAQGFRVDSADLIGPSRKSIKGRLSGFTVQVDVIDAMAPRTGHFRARPTVIDLRWPGW